MKSHLSLLATALMSALPAAQDPGASTGEDAAMAGSIWGRNYFPNVTLVNHRGEEVQFFDDVIQGKVVALNFIYTSCPDSCPLETARMVEVQEILGDRVGRDVHFYSVTIDPEVDTPEVLAEYREQYGIGEGWDFLTGSEADITLLRRKLGLYIQEIQSEDTNDHNLSLVIGNQATGRWMKRSPFENPYVLANQIGGWLHNWTVRLPEAEERPYEEAPELRNISKGEGLFRTRCAVCHVIGFDQQAIKRVGPNLYGATDRRERDWLERWLRAPDEMLRQKDPIAMSLFEAYNRVPMPNFRLTEKDIDLLIEFIEEESRRLEEEEPEALMAALEIPDEVPACCQKRDSVVIDHSGADHVAQSTELLPVVETPTEPSVPAEPSVADQPDSNRRLWVSGLILLSSCACLALGVVTAVRQRG